MSLLESEDTLIFKDEIDIDETKIFLDEDQSEITSDVRCQEEELNNTSKKRGFKKLDKRSARRHKKSKHEGVKYVCDEFDYIATLASDIKCHKESKHEGVRYPSDECHYIASSVSDPFHFDTDPDPRIRFR